MKKLLVVALGGNALGKTNEEQLKLVKKTAKELVDLGEKYNLVITHGNGPQVGKIKNAMENSSENMPFPECGAMSVGYIGYHLQQSIQNELDKRKIKKNCVSVVTQVLVDKKDKAFKNPTKPIGNFYTKEKAQEIAKETGYTFKEDSGRGYRRTVASPSPTDIIELDSIKDLLEEGNIVIACGGGGIPVINKNNKLVGIDAVIDKDLSSALLAEKLKADGLLILTDIEKVCINFKQPDEQKLNYLTLEEADKYIENNEFKEGSMLPKVEACLKFVKNTNKKAIITSLDKAYEAMNGLTGTVICSSKEEEKEMKNKKKTTRKKNFKFGISAFSIILVLIILLGVLTHFLPTAEFVGDQIVNGSGVVKATLANVLMSPIEGFADAIDVCIFVFILGGFLNIIQKTGALETGVKVLVQKLKGKELILIPILMFIFSVGVLENLGIEVVDVTISSVADYYAIKDKELDKEVISLVNIGKEKTVISVFNKGILIKEKIISYGGDELDEVIGFNFKTDDEASKKIKEDYGVSNRKFADSDEDYQITNRLGQKTTINQYVLSEIIEYKLVEILKNIKNEINNLTNREISYIIVTGAITSMLGFGALVEDIYGRKGQLLTTNIIGIRDNKYSSSYGAIKYFINKLELREKEYTMFIDEKVDEMLRARKKMGTGSALGKIFGKIFE